MHPGEATEDGNGGLLVHLLEIFWIQSAVLCGLIYYLLVVESNPHLPGDGERHVAAAAAELTSDADGEIMTVVVHGHGFS